MGLAIDHLVVAARSLDEGAAWVESRLGVAPAGGGRHPLMGTHNRVLGLGHAVYLEVIAVDPGGAQPPRPRWFSLDAPAMRERLERGPALIHWAASADDIVALATDSPVDLGEVIALSRGDLRWRITVPRDGGLPAGGVFPSLIQWEQGSPAAALPDSGCRLESLVIAHPSASSFGEALRAMGLPADAPLAVDDVPGASLVAHIRTPGGVVTLP
jgi:Glyoxalase-like domain